MVMYVTEKDGFMGIVQIIKSGSSIDFGYYDKYVEVDESELEGVTDLQAQVSIIGDSEPEWQVVVNTNAPIPAEEEFQKRLDAWDSLVENLSNLESPVFEPEEPDAPTIEELGEWAVRTADYLSKANTALHSLYRLTLSPVPRDPTE